MRPLKIVLTALSICGLSLLVSCGDSGIPATNPPDNAPVDTPVNNPPGTLPDNPENPPTNNPTNPPTENPTNPPTDNPPSPYQGATSLTCENTKGAEALYWDYGLGVNRADYPQTVRFLPYAPGISFFHPVQPLYSFFYPQGWEAFELTDPSQQLTGVNVVRQDGRAAWRNLNYTLPGAVTVENALNGEVQGMLSFIGNPQNVQTVCFFVSPDRTFALVLLRAGDFTAQVFVRTFVSSLELIGTSTVVLPQVVVAPTAEYDDTAVNVFFPLTGQLTPGGSSGKPECSDGEDNDGDGLVDYPNDTGCTSADDDSE